MINETRYGFFDQTSKTKSESRLALLSIPSLSKIPKFPLNPPPRIKASPQSTNIHTQDNGYDSAAVKAAMPPEALTKLSQRAMGKMKEKEESRVGKWERMLIPAERDQGGNIRRWKWIESGKGAKVSLQHDWKFFQVDTGIPYLTEICFS